MAISWTDYNGLQPYFSAYRALAAQYGFPADQGDLLLATDPNFRNWVLTGQIPYVAPAPRPVPTASPTPTSSATTAPTSSTATSGAAPSTSTSAGSAPDYSLVTVSGLDLAGPTVPSGGGASGPSSLAVTVNQAPAAAGAPGLSWWWLVAIAAAVFVLKE